MSADSMRKQSKQSYQVKHVLPLPVKDPSIIESVTGFIQDVVPQAYSGGPPSENRDGILWAKFETADYNDPEYFPQTSDCENESTPPLLLVLGYSTGVQVWSIKGNGEGEELLTWCHGSSVRSLKFLPRPPHNDSYGAVRPLVALVDSGASSCPFNALTIISLKTGETVKIIKFHSSICEVYCNKKNVVVTFSERIAVFDSSTFHSKLAITTCYVSPGICLNPVALGSRWLAYSEKKLTTWMRSSGGCEGDGAHSYTSHVIHAARSLGKGLRDLGGSLTGTTMSPTSHAHDDPGVVSIIDLETKSSKEEDLSVVHDDSSCQTTQAKLMAHFVAHARAVVSMTWDPSGSLLVTADRDGHRFNLFRIHPHPSYSNIAAVQHLYTLHRGDTTARVQNISVSWDSRWVAVSTTRGTTHVFPISSYGGAVTVRTHTTSQVVNRFSRFERSAGLGDGRGSPLPVETPPVLPQQPPHPLPPFPPPHVVLPLAQIRGKPDNLPLATAFAPSRAWLPGAKKIKKTNADPLFIISSSGSLVEYELDPKCVQGVPKEKISYDTPIELVIEAKAEWELLKHPYSCSMGTNLQENHPLLEERLTDRRLPDGHKGKSPWLSEVEINTYTGPHRRLWMGPQFSFTAIDPLPHRIAESVGDNESREKEPSGGNRTASSPVNLPNLPAQRPFMIIQSGSCSSVNSPQLTELDEAGGRLREDLADAMMETAVHHPAGSKGQLRRAHVEWQVNPLGAVRTFPPSWEPSHPSTSTTYHHYEFSPRTTFVTFIPELLVPYSSVESQDSSVQTSAEDLEEAAMTDPSDKAEVDCLNVPIASLETNDFVIENANINDETDNQTTPFSELQTEIIHNPVAEEIIVDFGQDVIIESKAEAVQLIPQTQPEEICSCEVSLVQKSEEESRRCDEASSTKKNEVDDKDLELGGKKSKRRKKIKKKTSKYLEIQEDSEFTSVSSSEDAGQQLGKTEETSEGTVTNDPSDKDPSVKDRENEPKVSAEAVVSTEPEDSEDVKPTIAEFAIVEAITEMKPSPVDETVAQEESIQVGGSAVTSSEETCKVETSVEMLTTVESADIQTTIELKEMEFSNQQISESDNFDENGNSGSIDRSDELQDQEVKPKLQVEDILKMFGFETDVAQLPPPLSPSSFVEEMPQASSPSFHITPEELIPVPVIPSRRKKKEKQAAEKAEPPDSSDNLLVEVSHFSPPIIEEEVLINIMSDDVPIDVSTENLMLTKTLETECVAEGKSSEDIVSTDIEKKLLPVSSEANLLLLEENQSDQVASTDRSEVEDVSSYSSKESDVSKKGGKKERSRRQRRSESMDKDIKKKSPSPAAKLEPGDSDSSDEAHPGEEQKLLTVVKAPKRKKGKRLEEPLIEGIKETADTRLLKSSSSDSADISQRRPGDNSCRSSVDKGSVPPCAGQQRGLTERDDRDSVYESCNDDGASDSLAFESSKEDFDEMSKVVVPTTPPTTTTATTSEPNSSNTEDRTDSNEKESAQTSGGASKKIRKQKKKKR